MTDDIKDRREAEFGKYERAYKNPRYRMKKERMQDAANDLAALPLRGSYLDVSCGQGDMLKAALGLGFKPVHGTEIIPELINGRTVTYSEAHALQVGDKSFDVATMFDVIEHLVPGDDEAACRELARVARHHVILTANNRPSFNRENEDLHINKRPYEEWDRLFREWFPGAVTWIKGERHYISEAWRVDL